MTKKMVASAGARISTSAIPYYRDPYSELKTYGHLLNTGKKGFALGLNSGSHGGEETSVICNLKLLEIAEKYMTSGSLFSLPVSNPISITMTGTRDVPYTAYDETADLNRVVSLEASGIPIEQHASMIARAHADHYRSRVNRTRDLNGLVIDMHTESAEDKLGPDHVLPYIRLSEPADDKLLSFLILCAELSGLTWVFDYAADSDEAANMDRTLDGVLLTEHIPSFTIELGPGGNVYPEFVEAGIQAVLNIMSHFHLLDPDSKVSTVPSNTPFPKTGENNLLRFRDAIGTDKNGNPESRQGFLELTIRPGDKVARSERIGSIIDPITPGANNRYPLYAPWDSYVLFIPGNYYLRYKPSGFAYQAAVPVQDAHLSALYAQVQGSLKKN